MENFITGFEPFAQNTPYERILAIGDVHGAAYRLESLLKKIQVTDNDLVIFLGDYFGDGNKQNLETLLRLVELNERENFIFLRGNMDEQFMTIFLRDETEGLHLLIKYFFRNQPSLFNACKQNVPKILFDFLNGLRPAHLVEVGNRKIFFCHAGIKVGTPLEKQRKNYLVGIYSCKDFYRDYSGDDWIVVGHKSPNKLSAKFDAHKPLKVPDKNILMLDTRAKDDDGRLTCADVLSGQYWQSDDAAFSVIFVCE